jgi:hypothetical protein
MSTITVPVTDETGLRQAVAEARSGDTIYVGSDIHLSAPLTISAGANLTIAGFGVTIEGSPNDGIDGSIIVDPGAALTIENMLVSNDDGDGASASDPGADVLGAVQNYGAVKLIDDSVMEFQSRAMARLAKMAEAAQKAAMQLAPFITLRAPSLRFRIRLSAGPRPAAMVAAGAMAAPEALGAMRSAASSMTGRSKPLARRFFTMIPRRPGQAAFPASRAATGATLPAPMG